MVKLTGGGLNSNKVTQSKHGKQKPISHKVGPEAAAQLGRSEQFRKPPLEAGRGYTPGAMGPTGVRGTFNSASQGLEVVAQSILREVKVQLPKREKCQRGVTLSANTEGIFLDDAE
jgi:hypothetical protein